MQELKDEHAGIFENPPAGAAVDRGRMAGKKTGI